MMGYTYAEFFHKPSVIYRCSFLLLIMVVLLFSTFTTAFSKENAKTGAMVVATVNDTPIYKSSVDLMVAQYQKKSASDEVTLDQKKQILDSMITRYLILQTPEAQALKNDDIIFQKMISYENSLITSKFVKDRVDKNIVVTDEETKEYYKDNCEKFRSRDKIQVRGMLLKTRGEADEILTKLHQGGDFVALTKENSIDLATARTGGRMEAIVKGSGKVFPQIEEALFKLNAGELSGLVKTDFGFNIFLVEQVYPAKLIPFEEVKDDIKKILLQNKKSIGFDQLSKSLQESADIKIYETKLMDD